MIWFSALVSTQLVSAFMPFITTSVVSSSCCLGYIRAGTLGDIMSDDDENKGHMHNTHITGNQQSTSKYENPISSGLVTEVGGTLQTRFGSKVPNLTPMERIALTANGNLQRIFSSFYDAHVHVTISYCERRKGTSCAVWDRTVHLSVFNQNFCTAQSTITVHSPECIQLIESENVGIGQLFRYLDKLPTFRLKDAGRCPDGGMWRSYELACDELTCDIHEQFNPRAWELVDPNVTDFSG